MSEEINTEREADSYLSSYEREIKDAKEEAARRKRRATIFEALHGMATAGGKARGGEYDASLYDRQRDDADSHVLDAKLRRKEAIAQHYRDKNENWRKKQAEGAEKWRRENFEQRERQIGASNEQRKSQFEAARNDKATAKAEKDQKDLDARTVGPDMIAKTPEDAKKLKSATEMKMKFDRQIGEMISLREKYGVEYANREAVDRGKQLSKDLLLTYKNLAKLGVLSKSDEDIVNAIIPSDPLGQDWAPGQDSIMTNLTKFRDDLNEDYNNSLKIRLSEGYSPDKSKTHAGQGSKKYDWEISKF